jgi:uncharacterized protein YraI
MKRLLIAASLALLAMQPATAGGRQDLEFFRVQASNGYMNMRAGPGTQHALLSRVPTGAIVSTTFCTERDDGIEGADWCEVVWPQKTGGFHAGWVSRAGLMPLRYARSK